MRLNVIGAEDVEFVIVPQSFANVRAHQTGTRKSKGRKSRPTKGAKARLQVFQDKATFDSVERALLQIPGVQTCLRDSKPLQQRLADQTEVVQKTIMRYHRPTLSWTRRTRQLGNCSRRGLDSRLLCTVVDCGG